MFSFIYAVTIYYLMALGKAEKVNMLLANAAIFIDLIVFNIILY